MLFYLPEFKIFPEFPFSKLSLPWIFWQMILKLELKYFHLGLRRSLLFLLFPFNCPNSHLPENLKVTQITGVVQISTFYCCHEFRVIFNFIEQDDPKVFYTKNKFKFSESQFSEKLFENKNQRRALNTKLTPVIQV